MHISKWLLSIKFTEWDPLQPFMHDILEPKSINNFHTEESIKCEFDNMQRFSFTMQFDQLPNRSTHTHTHTNKSILRFRRNVETGIMLNIHLI